MDRSMFEPYPQRRRTAVQLNLTGMWLRLLFVGASLAAGGLAVLFQAGGHRPLPALSAMALGIALGIVAWRRARDFLESGGESEAGVVAGTSTVLHRAAWHGRS